jgi:hypothetical protein
MLENDWRIFDWTRCAAPDVLVELLGESDVGYRRPIEDTLSHRLVSKGSKLVDLVGACGSEDRLDFMPTDDLGLPPSYAAAEHPS